VKEIIEAGDGTLTWAGESDESSTNLSGVKGSGKEDLQLRLFGYSEEEAAWRKQALCKGMGEAVFFPDRGYSMLPAYVICHGCPVRMECLESSFEWGDDLGVRAGFTPYEREKIQEKVAEGTPLELAVQPWDKAREGKLLRARTRV
jgi:WhiB family redox-sensing transcriptional regulator